MTTAARPTDPEGGRSMADVIATDKCYVNGVLAANAGDAVPAELADKYDWPVARKGTKKATEATEAE